MALPRSKPDPNRFNASKLTLLVDRFMTHFIKVGGVLVVTSVLGIFVFILSQILPLMRSAEVKEVRSIAAGKGDYAVIGADEWSALPFLAELSGKVHFLDVNRGTEAKVVDVGQIFTALDYDANNQQLVGGTADGKIAFAKIDYGSSVDESGAQTVTGDVKLGALSAIGRAGAAITSIALGGDDNSKLIGVIQAGEGQWSVHAVRLARKRSLMGTGELKVDQEFDVSKLIPGRPETILVTGQADGIVVTTADGTVHYLFRAGEQFELRQSFKPFGDRKNPRIAKLDFLFGDVSLVVTGEEGENRVFSLYRHSGDDKRTFGQTKTFADLPGAATFYNSSLRNKAFLTGSGKFATLRYSTTQAIRWEQALPFTVDKALIGGKYNRLLFLDTDAKLHVYDLHDPHPESSFKALFGKVWYEGYPAPSFEWQSTGGTDDFEPKMSLVPLIIGTLKGTLYAMIFAVPIALLAAIYTSQFLAPRFKAVVKPTMEIMASLPSVVLGFLAALWLAPLLETHVPGILACIVLVPTSAMAIGYVWSRQRIQIRRQIKPGYEFLVFLPILVLLCWGGWNLGPVLENIFFFVRDPETGAKIADFRLWWPQVVGAPFEQRNSLVVGFMMGFAVIPIIFTISEDALSNVPVALVSGSLALGASRWQTAVRVILPTASPGIFSALMIGLGRAVGETMIVVMATGNTPVISWNIFSGMRTLAANIAVELPEAPHHGTLYRTLFLGAMLLFLTTFLVNTVAEVMRQHLREKYKTV